MGIQVTCLECPSYHISIRTIQDHAPNIWIPRFLLKHQDLCGFCEHWGPQPKYMVIPVCPQTLGNQVLSPTLPPSSPHPCSATALVPGSPSTSTRGRMARSPLLAAPFPPVGAGCRSQRQRFPRPPAGRPPAQPAGPGPLPPAPPPTLTPPAPRGWRLKTTREGDVGVWTSLRVGARGCASQWAGTACLAAERVFVRSGVGAAVIPPNPLRGRAGGAGLCVAGISAPPLRPRPSPEAEPALPSGYS